MTTNQGRAGKDSGTIFEGAKISRAGKAQARFLRGQKSRLRLSGAEFCQREMSLHPPPALGKSQQEKVLTRCARHHFLLL